MMCHLKRVILIVTYRVTHIRIEVSNQNRDNGSLFFPIKLTAQSEPIPSCTFRTETD